MLRVLVADPFGPKASSSRSFQVGGWKTDVIVKYYGILYIIYIYVIVTLSYICTGTKFSASGVHACSA